MTSPIMKAILIGAARKVSPLPGEYGAQFIQRLHEDIHKNLKTEDSQRFLFIRSCVNCAINSSNQLDHDSALKWIKVANHLISLQLKDAINISRSCLKAAEAYCQLKAGKPDSALNCLDEANQADALASISEFPSIPAQRMHYIHLKARIMLSQNQPVPAIKLLLSGIEASTTLAKQGYRYIDLLSYSCSRLAGELAISNKKNISTGDYLSITESLTLNNSEGSITEYLHYRKSLFFMNLQNNIKPILDFIKLGRMKTICWYVAIIDVAKYLDYSEKTDLVILSSQWRDFPKELRDHLMELI